MNWQIVLRNGFWLLIPILVWNLIFSSKLTHPALIHDQEIAKWVLILENVLRMAVMTLPFFLIIKGDTIQAKVGWCFYIVGVIVYFVSWIPLMTSPNSAWSNSLLGFTAPASTPVIWLTGIGLIGTWYPYLAVAALFVGGKNS